MVKYLEYILQKKQLQLPILEEHGKVVDLLDGIGMGLSGERNLIRDI